jgi:hypothetical protein
MMCVINALEVSQPRSFSGSTVFSLRSWLNSQLDRFLGQISSLDLFDDLDSSFYHFGSETDFLFDFPIANKAPNCPGKQKKTFFSLRSPTSRLLTRFFNIFRLSVVYMQRNRRAEPEAFTFI